MTGVGLPVTSHTKLIGWLRTTDTLPGVSPSRKSGGTVAGVKNVIITWEVLLKTKWYTLENEPENWSSPLTLSWYFLSVDPASLTAAQTYSPLSSGDTEARISSVPSSRMDTPGSLPVNSWPLRNQRITGLGRPGEEMKAGKKRKRNPIGQQRGKHFIVDRRKEKINCFLFVCTFYKIEAVLYLWQGMGRRYAGLQLSPAGGCWRGAPAPLPQEALKGQCTVNMTKMQQRAAETTGHAFR